MRLRRASMTAQSYRQIKYSIYPEFDEVRDVYNRAIEYGWVLFQQTLPIIESHQAPRPQNHSEALYYNKEQMGS